VQTITDVLQQHGGLSKTRKAIRLHVRAVAGSAPTRTLFLVQRAVAPRRDLVDGEPPAGQSQRRFGRHEVKTCAPVAYDE
jgi:hypothetical protein